MTNAAEAFPAVRAFRELQQQSRLLEKLQVVFIVGPPKCGTTWVQTTMNGHPHAVALGEGHMATRLLAHLSSAIRAFNADQTGRAQESRSAPSTALQLDQADTFVLTRQAFDRILIHYLQTLVGSPKTSVKAVMDKTPDHARHIPALAALYPWAKFICVTRDVRDAAVSAWHHRELLGVNTHESIDELAPAFAADVWAPMLALARGAARALPPSTYTEIAYEDYKADPAGQVSRLLRFLNLDDSDASIRACLDAGDFKRQSRGREPGVEAKSFHRKGIVGDWQNHLAPHIAELTLRIANEHLTALLASMIEAKTGPAPANPLSSTAA